ncbi:MAG TPA: PIN domain-containing protein [Candidatus Binatia bacterium]|nr:PIN domain-containing protein [Candidatus Binatia bacterium]
MDNSARLRVIDSTTAQPCHVVPRANAGTGRRPERALIYLDASVALAHLLVEDVSPPEKLWQESLVSSRLIEYEIWTRIHARKLARSHADEVRSLLARVALVELSPPVLTRALEPFPKPVRTLDAIHLASIDFLQRQGQTVNLASYDDRMITAARALRFPIYHL